MDTNLTDTQRAALQVIKDRSAARPITGKEVAGAIGLKPRSTGKEGADMRGIIHALRVKGYPICATGAGYWWPQNREELKGYIASFQGRVDDQIAALDGLKSALPGVEKITVPDEKLTYIARTPEGLKMFSVLSSQLKAFLTKYPNAARRK